MASERFAEMLDGWINPIAIKEMRQAVKGKFIVWALMIFLAVQLVVIGTALVLAENIGKDFSIGRGVFTALVGVLMGACLLLLPAYVGIRLAGERSDKNVDLFFITTIKPTSIIWGKAFAAAIVTILFFSASLPFMTLTYLLRGLDVPTMFVMLAMDFLVVLTSIQFGILLACLPGGMVSRAVRGLMAVFLLFVVFWITVGISVSMLTTGIGSSVATWEFWGMATTVAVLILLGNGMLFVLSATAITPKSANRAFVGRVYLLFVWLITAALAMAWSFATGDDDARFVWATAMVVLFSAAMFVSVCERLEWGPRVVRTIPRNALVRAGAFLLYSGASGGIAFSLLAIGITLLLELTLGGITTKYSSYRMRGEMATLSIALYAACYALTALLIRRVVFPKSTRADATVVVASLLVTLGTAAPVTIGFLLRTNPAQPIAPGWFIANPFFLVWHDDMALECYTFVSGWFIAVFAATLPWFMRQVAAFKPLPVLPAIQETQQDGCALPPIPS